MGEHTEVEKILFHRAPVKNCSVCFWRKYLIDAGLSRMGCANVGPWLNYVGQGSIFHH